MPSRSKTAIIAAILTIAIGIGIYVVSNKPAPAAPTPEPSKTASEILITIGQSVQSRNLEAYVFGTGPKHLLFVGGIHGGYEWNSVALTYEFIDYLKAHPDFVPSTMTISVIPSANPDGVFKVLGKEGRFTAAEAIPKWQTNGTGRFNANDVDLNRNFDCKWKPESTWRSKTVSAGSAPFSEPETLALKNYILDFKPLSVVFWHSQSNAVYASECENGILPKTLEIMDLYSKAAGYKAVKKFDAYEITGDAEGWLASINIPSITVELKTHETVEWEQNFAGIEALIKYFNQ